MAGIANAEGCQGYQRERRDCDDTENPTDLTRVLPIARSYPAIKMTYHSDRIGA